MAATPRNKTIDILKGWAIMLVVLGHLELTPPGIKVWIYSFHLPLFFFCSGLLFKPGRYGRFADFLRARLRGIVLPYVTLGIFVWVLVKLWEAFLAWRYAAPERMFWDPGYLFAALALNFRLHNYYYDMWFLNTLFVSELLFYGLMRLTRGKWQALLALSPVFALVQALVSRHIRGAVWSVDLAPACLSFLCLGGAVRQFGPRAKALLAPRLFPPALALNLALGLVHYARIDERVDLYSGVVGSPLLFWLAACAGIWAACAAAAWMGSMRITEFFGRGSLIVYAFQQKLMIRVAEELSAFLAERSSLAADPSFRWVFVFLTALLLSAGMIVFIRRFCPWMLGKPVRRGQDAA